MPALTAEQEAVIQEKEDQGLLSPQLLDDWKAYKAQQWPSAVQDIYAPPAPQPEPKSWAGQFLENVGGDIKYLYEQAGGEPFVKPGSPWDTSQAPAPPAALKTPDLSVDVTAPVPTLVTPETPPGKASDIQGQYTKGVRTGGAEALRWLPTIIAALVPPAGIAPGAYTGVTALFAQVGAPLIRAAWMFLGQTAAEMLAHIVDPESKLNLLDPKNLEQMTEKAAWQAGGEFGGTLGGKALDAGGRWIDRGRARVFGETPYGTIRREVSENLGERPTLGMASDTYWSQALDQGTVLNPLGSRVRSRYEQVDKALDTEMRRHAGQHPGDKVAQYGEQAATDLAGLADPLSLDRVPYAVRRQLDRFATNSMPSVVNADLRTGYQALDADYFGRQVPWTLGQPAQVSPTLAMPRPRPRSIGDLLLDPTLEQSQGIGPESIFGQTVRLLDNLENLGPHVSLDTAMEMQRTVSGFLKEAEQLAARDPKSLLTQSINDKLRPALGEAQAEINKAIAPYAVSLQAAKRNAEQIVGRVDVSDAVLEGLLSAGNITGQTVDPDVLLAYKLLKQPDFVNFSQAHGLRHEWLAASRLPGHPMIGESTVTRSKGMADMIDGSMQAMTDRMAPEMTTAWKTMDQQYKGLAQLYNSEYIGEVAGKNLDDILTQLIRSDRPNDIKALRDALGMNQQGGEMIEDVAQMWLTKRIEMATPQSTGTANLKEVLDTLDAMPPATATALFPRYPIAAVRDTLRKQVDMQAAVDVTGQGLKAKASELQILKNRINDPARWDAVVSDTLAPMFKGDLEPFSPENLLTNLQSLRNVKDVLFAPGHYDELTRLAHTTRMVQDTMPSGHMHWVPAVRFLSHNAVAPLAIHWLAGPYVAGGFVVSSAGLSWLLSQPWATTLLTRGVAQPHSSQRAMEMAGMILGQLQAHGLGSEVTMLPSPAGQPQEEPAPR